MDLKFACSDVPSVAFAIMSATLSLDIICSTVMSPDATSSRERRYLFPIHVRLVRRRGVLNWWKTALLSWKQRHGVPGSVI